MDDRRADRLSRLRDRLAQGEIVVLDGGTGTGLQELGVPMDGEAWSGVANLTHLRTVRELHAAYLAAGAEVLITNTFAAGPGPLTAAGYGSRFEEANRNAFAAADEARTQAGRDDIVIAGSMSRMVAEGLITENPDASGLRDAYGRQAAVLADAGADLIVLEMMGARAHAQPAVAAAADHGLTVWLGISIVEASDDTATTIDGEDVAELIAALPAEAIDAVFVMHSDIDLVSPSLRVIRRVWPGTIGAYPHVGDWTPPDWVFHEIAPAAFAGSAADWVANGATVVGGCCGIGPRHIAELSGAVRARTAS